MNLCIRNKYTRTFIYCIIFCIILSGIVIFFKRLSRKELFEQISIFFDKNGFEHSKYIILLFGKFFNDELLPELNNLDCNIIENFIIKRSDVIIYFDILILHFHEYRLLLDYNVKFSLKKLIIILALEAPYSINSLGDLYYDLKNYKYLTISYYNSSFYKIPYGKYWYTKVNNYNEDQIYEEFIKRIPTPFTLISNCDFPHSLRISFIDQLSEFITIHKYGDCFNDQITLEQREMLFNHSMYFIAIENSICSEYVTEKYWDSITKHTIPIVLAHKDSNKVMIPGSYIDITQFDSALSLNEELLKISFNFTYYKKFFEWKKNIDFVSIRNTALMDGCIFLTNLYNYMIHDRYNDETIVKLNDENLCMSDIEFDEWINNYF